MNKFTPLLTPEILKDATACYLNENALKGTIRTDQILSFNLNFYPFLDIKADYEIKFSYQKGYLNKPSYQQALQLYEIAHNQFESAKSAKIQAYNNAPDNQKLGLLVGNLQAPTKPKEEDYVDWKEHVSDSTQHKETFLKPVRPKLLPSFIDNPEEIASYLPAKLLEDSTLPFNSIAEGEKNELIKTTLLAAANKVVTAFKVPKFYSRDLSLEIGANNSICADLYLPIWEITYQDHNENKKVYVDELNGKILGAMIKESDTWSSIIGKHISLLISLWILTLIVLGEPDTILRFFGLLIAQPAFFIVLNYFQEKSEKKSRFIDYLLNFFYIKELLKTRGRSKAQTLENYIIQSDQKKEYIAQKLDYLEQFKAHRIYKSVA